MEHHNRLVKEYRVQNRTSSLPASFLLEKASLIAPQNKRPIEPLAAQLNRRENTFHARKSASEDVLALASRLVQKSVQPRKGRESVFVAQDLMMQGLQALEINVQ